MSVQPALGLMAVLVAVTGETQARDFVLRALTCTSEVHGCTAPDKWLGEIERATPGLKLLTVEKDADGYDAVVERRGNSFPATSLVFSYSIDFSGRIVRRECHSGLPAAGADLRTIAIAPQRVGSDWVEFLDPCYRLLLSCGRYVWVRYPVVGGRLGKPTTRRAEVAEESADCVVSFSRTELRLPVRPAIALHSELVRLNGKPILSTEALSDSDVPEVPRGEEAILSAGGVRCLLHGGERGAAVEFRLDQGLTQALAKLAELKPAEPLEWYFPIAVWGGRAYRYDADQWVSLCRVVFDYGEVVLPRAVDSRILTAKWLDERLYLPAGSGVRLLACK